MRLIFSLLCAQSNDVENNPFTSVHQELINQLGINVGESQLVHQILRDICHSKQNKEGMITNTLNLSEEIV